MRRELWRPGVFLIAVARGLWPDLETFGEEREGWISPDGCWAADRRGGRQPWTLNHVPTGFAVGYFDYLADARDFAEAIGRDVNCRVGKFGNPPKGGRWRRRLKRACREREAELLAPPPPAALPSEQGVEG